MKKFLTFLALALVTVTGAWAQTSGFTTCSPILVTEAQEGYFLIDGFAQANKNHHFVYDNGGNFATAENIGTDFDSYVWHVTAAEGGKYNFQNVSTGKYITIDGNQMKLTDAPGAIAFDFSGGFGSLGTGGNAHYDCGNTGTGTTTWNDGVSGSRRMRIYKAETIYPDESFFLNLKSQNVKYVNESGKNFKVVSDVPNTNEYVFKFNGTPNDGYTIYNEGCGAYLLQNDVDATDNVKAVTTTDASAATRYDIRYDGGVYFFAIHGSNTHVNQRDGYFSTWKNSGWGDVGSKIIISKVEPYPVIMKNAPAGAKISLNGKDYAEGDGISPFDFTSASDITATAVTGYTAVIAKTGNNVVVNYQPDIDLTDLAVKSVGAMTTTVTEGQWYVMTQIRDGETPVFDNGVGVKVRTEESKKVADIFTVLCPAVDVDKYLIRFINTGADSYAIQFGNGNYWKNEGTPARGVGVLAAAGAFDKYIFNEATNTGDGNKTGLAINATEDGVNYGFNVDHENTKGGCVLNYWSNGKQASGSNNVWYIYPVEIGAVSSTATVTYNYYLNNKLVKTESNEQEVGETIAEPASLHVFTANEYAADTKVASTGNTVRVDVTETTPFVAAESIDEVEHWYALNIRDSYWLYNTGSAPVTGSSNYEVSDKYAWAFVGNILDGYTIYNKEAGTAVALSADNPCKLTADGAEVTWTIPRVGTIGDTSFGLKAGTQDPLNWDKNNSVLARWSGFDIGSTFKVVEVYLGEQDYNVIITGAPEGTKITCDGSQYANGETLTADLKETPVSASTIDGYFTPSVEVVGLDINVAYKKFPFEIADSFANIEHWYALTVHSNQTHYLYTDDGDLLFNAEGYDETDAYAWGFVGNNTDGYTIYNKATGSSVALDNNEPAAVSDDGVNIGWLVSTSSENSDKGKNGFTIYLDSNSAEGKYLNYNANSGALYHWKNRDAGSTFTPTEINPVPEGLPVVIGPTGYATFYDEDNRIIPTGVKAYYCTQGEEGVLGTVQITNLSYIPRWTGVILEGTPGTYYFEEIPTNMADEEETDKIMDDNVLNGTLDDMSVEDLRAELGDYVVYVLAKKNGRLGFYQFTGNTLAGRKAFYVNANALVSGFILDFNGTEGINSVISATNLKAGYDIQGRKLNKMQKGINILGGKKIIK